VVKEVMIKIALTPSIIHFNVGFSDNAPDINKISNIMPNMILTNRSVLPIFFFIISKEFGISFAKNKKKNVQFLKSLDLVWSNNWSFPF
jgi:hypothetical protein